MRKRITCRVINSVHSRAAEADLLPVIRTQCMYETEELTAAKFWFEQVKTMTGNLRAFEIEKGMTSIPSGGILDCLA